MTHSSSPKELLYADLVTQVASVIQGEVDYVANLANTASLIYFALNGSALGQNVNWAGFYLNRGGDELVLGPFQGKVACIRIKKGRGVCGTCWADGKVQLVPDVHAFQGHIACDAESESEVVLPLMDNMGRFLGVLDLDSPLKGHFDAIDVEGLSQITSLLSGGCNWSPLTAAPPE
eukprot:GGOE01020471.1.p1 GENE.GGOE01020471.1~~GGOE01020471.1.p1  ORF type:complete len:176 (-),score=18.63 GGOE01020471.1:364-891(-)